MSSRIAAALLALVIALLAPVVEGAASVQPLTPERVSILGGTSREFAVRFFDATGQPAVGETVTFANDACGYFPNGSAVTQVRTDATGLASVLFTARTQGITCWLTASAGVQARFDVDTFVMAQVHLQAQLEPPRPLPGQRFTVEVTPMAGAYRLYEVQVAARVIPGTGTATISPASAGSGQAGAMSFEVTPQGMQGAYEIELRYGSVTKRVPVPEHPAPWQDMWWAGPAQNGWGMSVIQHRDVLFSVIYAYDGAGKPTWFVMPGGAWDAAGREYSGPLYAPSGSPYHDYRSSAFEVGAPVGSASLRFLDAESAVLEYTIHGLGGRKSLVRQRFGVREPPLADDRADMWWGGLEQNGWGIAVLQQYRALFAVWFTYDASGMPTWFVMPSGWWSGPATYEGRIYRATGSPWLGMPYDPKAFRTTEVGRFRLRFSGEEAIFEYTIDGAGGTMALSRQPF